MNRTSWILIALVLGLSSGLYAQTATQLDVAVQPAGAEPGLPFTTQPVVEALDAGNVLDSTFAGLVTAEITMSTGTSGAVLLGTVSVNAVAGVATFTDLAIDLAGTGYTLTFTSGMLTPADSAPFDVVAAPGPATQLIVTTQPGNAAPGVAFGIQPVVEARDAGDALDTTFGGPVTAEITMNTGTAGAVLSGTVMVNAVGGVATFTDLSIDLSGTGYTLTFTSGTLTPAVSAPFDVLQAGSFTCHHDLGRGLGFWANKPGKDILSGHDTAWRDEVGLLDLVVADGSAFDLATGDFDTAHASFRAWILGANAKNMAYMLSAQMMALVLNLEFGPMSALSDPHVEINNVHVPLWDLIDDANDLLALHPVALPPGQERDDQEALKDLFDAINNGAVPVCEPDGPPVGTLVLASTSTPGDGDDETAGCTLAGAPLPVLPLLAALALWRRRPR